MASVRRTRRKPQDESLEAIRLASTSERKAVELLEEVRWGSCPNCPHCRCKNVYRMQNAERTDRNKDFRWRCRACNRQYTVRTDTVRTDTVMAETKLPLRHWVHAFWRIAASKKGVSALQIKRELNITYEAAWFLCHRVRLAMQELELAPLGGEGETVEADETYVGGVPRRPEDRRFGRGTTKTPVFAVVQRQGGVRMKAMDRLTADDLGKALREGADPKSRLMTDEFKSYRKPGKDFAAHEAVKHGRGEFAKGEAHSNTVESVFAILKRGLHGTFHSVSRHHLFRYLAEFQFRWNRRKTSDAARAFAIVRHAVGKRLLYRLPLDLLSQTPALTTG